jgi:ribosome-associated heat shock protein Hsp15
VSDGVRIDKWLWAARFYKTRSLAAAAVAGGKVRVNRARVKPARPVKVGDALEVHKGGYEYSITVLAVSGQRGSATLAQNLYQESPDSVRKRQLLTEQHRLAAASAPLNPTKRPGGSCAT